jgi:hypothetical protein
MRAHASSTQQVAHTFLEHRMKRGEQTAFWWWRQRVAWWSPSSLLKSYRPPAMLAHWTSLRVSSTLALLRRTIHALVAYAARMKLAERQAHHLARDRERRILTTKLRAWTHVICVALRALGVTAPPPLTVTPHTPHTPTTPLSVDGGKQTLLHWMPPERHPFRVYPGPAPCIQQTEDESAAGRALEARHLTHLTHHAQSAHTGSNVECMSNVESLSNGQSISTAAFSAAASTLFEAQEAGEEEEAQEAGEEEEAQEAGEAGEAQDSPQPQHDTERQEAREEACVCWEREEACVCEERSAWVDDTRGSRGSACVDDTRGRSAWVDDTPQPRPLHLHLHLPIQNDRHQLAGSWWSKTTSWSDSGHFTVHEARKPPEKETAVQEEEAEWEEEEARPRLPQPHPAYHPAQHNGNEANALNTTVSFYLVT